MGLDIWQKKIQEKRKNTPFRDFLLEVASWWSINLYRNNNSISIFPPHERSGSVIGIADYIARYENVLDGLEIGHSFLEQFSVLFRSHTKAAVSHVGSNENADYCNTCFGTKNAYLSFVSGFNTENIFYSTQTWENVQNVFNSSLVTNGSSNVYHSRVINNSYNVFFSQYMYNCSGMWFCSSCIGCHHCIDCEGLENMSYCIGNKQYTQDIFEQMKRDYTPEKFSSLHGSTFAKKGLNFSCNDCVGSGLYRCNNLIDGYNAMHYADSKNVVFSDGLTGVKNYYDCIDTGTNSNDFYAICQGGEDSNHCYMCNFVSMGCFNVFYSIHMESCSFCLGCVGLKNKQFCILNKQYTKEERHVKVDEIFSAMEQEGKLGEFFPASMNPFYFNDTAAYLIDPSFTKDEVIAQGYLRRDQPVKVDIPEGVDVVKVSELGEYEGWKNMSSGVITKDLGDYKDSSVAMLSQNDAIQRYIDPAILTKIIVDEEGNYYRIMKMEYDFLVKHGLPLPRKHWLDRMKENFRMDTNT